MIRTRGVVKKYGETVALDAVDLCVQEGTVHVLAGPNGSGKTTLLDTVLGRVSPDSGTVESEGDIGCAFQEPRVLEDLSVAENLSVFGARDDGVVESLRLGRVLDRRASALSDGFRKKLDIALALAGEPDALLLDEPLADLDDVSRRRLVELVSDYAADGNAVLVSTHRIEEFDRTDRLTVLYDGEVVLDVSTDELETPPHEAYLRAVERAESEEYGGD